MKNRIMKCWLLIVTLALSFGMGQNNRANAQCSLSFSGPSGNVLTSFIDL